MSRPFEPIYRQHVAYEVKYGEKKVTSGGKTAPTKLDHFKVIYRNRGDKINWDTVESVHSILGEKPKSIPIRLLSDSVEDNLSMFRGYFSPKHAGKLLCGAQVGSPIAQRVMPMENTTIKKIGNTNVHSGGSIGRGELLESPISYECSDDCPVWRSEDVQKQCKIRSKFFFTIDVPGFNSLCIARVNGIYAQISLAKSLETIKNISYGMLANIPLEMSLHFEKHKEKIGSYYPDIPYITIELRQSLSEHNNFLLEEIRRRKEMNDIITSSGGVNSSGLFKTGVLEGLWSPKAMFIDDIESSEESDSSLVFLEEDQPSPREAVLASAVIKNSEVDDPFS